MTFGIDGFTPFILANVDGLYLSDNNVTISDNTMTDGGTYQGSVKKKRNIVLTLMDAPNNVYNQKNRDALYVLFAEASIGTLTYEENGETRKIDYYVEKVYKPKMSNRLITISLLCADPFFYDVYASNVQMANWIADFEFIHEFYDSEELAHRSNEKLVNIVNDTATDNIGITIILEASYNVRNPRITRVESDKYIQLGTEDFPFDMVSGDVVIITTGVNDKHVYLQRGSTQTEINEYLTEESIFLQLMRGNNNIGYSAASGEEYLSVTIQYRMKYSGA
jgi:hypothetical protein